MHKLPKPNQLGLRLGLTGLVFLMMLGFWRLPSLGSVLIATSNISGANLWPQIHLESLSEGQSSRIIITDITPWVHVKLIVNGKVIEIERYDLDPKAKIWTWTWLISNQNSVNQTIIFYYNCDTGCIERGRWTLGSPAPTPVSTERRLTKLGVVFANPERDWNNWSGWNIELTYALDAESDYWGIDDLAERIQNATGKGLRVLVRADYAQGQTLPPSDDLVALDQYLSYLRRLARDARLREVYGFIIGSGPNAIGSSSLAPEKPITPEWYARVFNGYGADISSTHNVVAVVHTENPNVRVLVGPVRPWINDQNGQYSFTVDAPWLNYMNSLVKALDEATQNNSADYAPDGFAIQAPGRPQASEIPTNMAANEPQLDLRSADWDGAQAGFRVYKDWLAIINAYSTTRGLPVFITSTNTSQPDTNIKPAENYPKGWLQNALEVINGEPQIKALCWFIDYFPHDDRWELFSLTDAAGQNVDALEDFNSLLNK